MGTHTVIVTGASSGLGAALARQIAAQQSNVVLFSPEQEKLEAVATECQALGVGALAVVGDVTQPQDCQRLVEQAVGRFGRIDALVANAGISMWSRFEEVEDLSVFRRLMEVNYLGAVYCVHHALPYLKESRGLIVAISSIQAKISVPLHSGYVASKHALQGFCETLRMELHDTGVDVLTVMPHWLRGTDLRQNALSAKGGTVGASSRRHSSESVSLEDACQAILKAMRQRQRDLIIPWKLHALLVLGVLRPEMADGIIMRAVRKQNE